MSFSTFIGFQIITNVYAEKFKYIDGETPSTFKYFVNSFKRNGHYVWAFFILALMSSLLLVSIFTGETIVQKLGTNEVDMNDPTLQWVFIILYTLTYSLITIGYIITFLYLAQILRYHYRIGKGERMSKKVIRYQKKTSKILHGLKRWNH